DRDQPKTFELPESTGLGVAADAEHGQKPVWHPDRAIALLPALAQQVAEDHQSLIAANARDGVNHGERDLDELLAALLDALRRDNGLARRQLEFVEVEPIAGHATLLNSSVLSNWITLSHITVPRTSMYLSGQRTILTSVASSNPDNTTREASAMAPR